jgi:hypothetical protein
VVQPPQAPTGFGEPFQQAAQQRVIVLPPPGQRPGIQRGGVGQRDLANTGISGQRDVGWQQREQPGVGAQPTGQVIEAEVGPIVLDGDAESFSETPQEVEPAEGGRAVQDALPQVGRA